MGKIASINRDAADTLGVDPFCTRLRYARQQRGLTQKALAELCGLSESRISQLEYATKFPWLADLRPLADALRCSIDFLAGRAAWTDEPFNVNRESIKDRVVTRRSPR